jgi:transmembrane sensor
MSGGLVMSGKDKYEERDSDQRKIAMVAVAWFTRMRSDSKTPEDERKFQAWLNEDEAHAAAYASIDKMWSRVGGLETLPGFHAMRQEALQTRTAHLRRFWRGGHRSAQSRPQPRITRRAVASIAAALALLITGGIFATFDSPVQPAGHTYKTAAGERSTFTLSEGSLVTLTSDSELKEIFCDNFRRIILVKGQAYFDVGHDPDRPFKVLAGRGVVTALGTEFDVYKKNGEVVVTLIEGSVEVAALHKPEEDLNKVQRLQVGERISYDKSGLLDVRKVDIGRAISWREGRIVVDEEPLLDVIDEMNRHSNRQLEVDRSDPRLKTLKINGTFKTGRPEALVDYLRAGGYQVWSKEDARGNITLRLSGERSHG